MSQDNTSRAKLARLADALLEDILAMPNSDILAHVDKASIQQARAVLIEVKTNMSQRVLAEAKDQLDEWRAAQQRHARAFDRAAALDRFEKIRRADPAFSQKVTLAARNSKALTDDDKEALMEDWADLQRLDEQDALE